MAAKMLVYREDARDKIRRGVNALAGTVKVTLGPRGRTVIIDQEFGPPQIVKWRRAPVLAHSMIQEGLKAGMNPMDLKRGIDLAVESVVTALKTIAQPCGTSQEIAHRPRSLPTMTTRSAS